MPGKGALAGVKIVDFGRVFVNPNTAMRLGVQGATVVRVESHTALDLQRMARPYKDNVSGLNSSGSFTGSNNSKYSITIDLRKPKGKELAMKLIRWADVVMIGMPPGTMEKLGLGYDDARKLKPDIIYFMSSQLGNYGPYSAFAGFGNHASAMSGLYSLTGWPDDEPMGQYSGAYIDATSPRFGVTAIMAALDCRRRTGKGQVIDQSQLEAATQLLLPLFMDCSATGRVALRSGNRLAYASPHGVFRCQGEDRWVAIAVMDEREWRSLCRVMGKPGLAGDPRFATVEARKKNEDELEKLIGEWTGAHSAEQAMDWLQAAGVPAGVVNNGKDLFDDPQLKHRGHFRFLNHSVMGVHSYSSPAYRLSKTPDQQFPAPALGEHNEFVLKEILKLSDDDIGDLLVEGAVTTDADLPEFKALA
jgi:benzylsuccinate CoA-transferase BbsF subunit